MRQITWDKYFIYFSYKINEYDVGIINSTNHIHDIYFKSQELAQRCIDEIIIPFEKGEL